MYRYLPALLLLIATSVAGRLFHPKAPHRASRPRLPKQGSVNATFFVPMLAETHATLFWQPQQSCFRATVNETIASGMKLGSDEPITSAEEATAKLGVGPTEYVYFPLPPYTASRESEMESWSLDARAWTTEHGFIDAPLLELCGFTGVFVPFLGKAFSPQLWSSLRQTPDPETINGEGLNGWHSSEKLSNHFEVTIYTTDNGVPKYLVFEGKPDYGLLASLTAKLL